MQFHEAHFVEAAERLSRFSLLPLRASWGLHDLISAVEAYQALGRPDSKYPVFPFEDVVMAAVWLGDIDQAKAALAKYESIASAWPENILPRYGGHRAWVESLRRLMDDPNVLRETARNHAERLKVTQLPKVEMPS